MACFSPLHGWYGRTLTENGKRPVVFSQKDGFADRPVDVPCGYCIGCRLDRARQWTIRNFIMFRSLSDVPELGKSFTVMQPGSVNNVFTVTEVSDKILGQIHFNCTAQLPISRVVVPRLE